MTARQRWSLAAVCTATFMLLLDITVVNVALPDIQQSLGSSFSDLQWVVDAYSLTLAALLLTAGSLADLFGRRRIFMIGLGVFAASSLACGLSPDPLTLNLARAVQGIGGAMMFATSLSLLAAEFQGRQRGTAFGIWGAIVGLAVAVGPLVGGALTEAAGWEWIFFINVPIGIGVITMARLRVGESSNPSATRLDWPGVLTFSTALFALVFALIRSNEKGWGSPLILGLIGGAAVLLIAFVVIEHRRSEPMLDLSLFRNRAFVGASAAAVAISASMFAMFLYLTLFIQNDLGYSPLQAGLRFLPLSVVSFFVAPVAGKLSAQLPIRGFLGGGLLLISIGLMTMRGLDPSSEWTALLPGFLIAGVGVGLVNPPLASAAISVVEPARSGIASGINNTFRQVGIATGIASLGAVFQSQISADLSEKLAGTAPQDQIDGLSQAVAGGGAQQVISQLPASAQAMVQNAAEGAFTDALNHILLIAAIVAAVGAVVSAGLVRGEDFVVAEGEPAHGERAPARDEVADEGAKAADGGGDRAEGATAPAVPRPEPGPA